MPDDLEPVHVSRETLPEWLSPAYDQLAAYADVLCTEAVTRGLIGPREVPRIWHRHILNCAAVADPALCLIPQASTVIDVGSGAGLPGIVWAIARPDLTVTLVEPLLRRSTFLEEVVTRLGLGSRVHVVRGRAEENVGRLAADITTARAVAPLDKLAGWLLPLTNVAMLAIKGSTAADELIEAAPVLARLGGVAAEVIAVGSGDEATMVVRVRATRMPRIKKPKTAGPSSAGRKRT